MRIKKIFQLSLAASSVIALTACGSMQNYEKAVNTWQGAPKQALFHEWGTPMEESQLANGNQLYTYRVVERDVPVSTRFSPSMGARMSPQSNAGMLSHSPDHMPQHDEAFWCETQFEVNNSGMIVNTNFKGNNCVASKKRAKQLAFVH